MLNQFREINLSWDRATKKIYENIQVASSDESGRKLVVQVVNGSQVEDLTNVILNLYWEHRSNKTNGLDHFKPVDAANGIFELYFTTEMLSNIGNLTANLHLIDATGTVTSEPFSIQVFKGIDNDAVQSSDSFTALTDALNRVVNIELNEGARQEEFEKNELNRANTFEESEAQRGQAFTASEAGRTDVFNQQEAERQAGEEDRKTAEKTRKTNEQTRESAESDRRIVETARSDAEDTRKTNEGNRQSNETARQSAEDTRATNEDARKSAENTREANEATRKSNETARKTAETNRESRFNTLVDELESIDVVETKRKTDDSVFTVDANNHVDFKNDVTKNGHRLLFFTELETW